MVDALMALIESPSITFYDYADPEVPDEIGKIYVRPKKGYFKPGWGRSGSRGGSEKNQYIDARVNGYVMDLELVVLAEL